MEFNPVGEPFRSGLAVILLSALALAFGQPQSFDAHSPQQPSPGKNTLRQIYCHWAFNFLVLGLAPFLFLRLTGGDAPSAMGLRPATGPWQVMLPGAALAIGLGYWASRQPEFLRSYPMSREGHQTGERARYAGLYLLYYLGWESFFRGFIQLHLGGLVGLEPALVLQTTASTLLHPNKPRWEVMGAAAGGILLGALALKTASIVPGLILHALLGFSTEYFCMRASAR